MVTGNSVKKAEPAAEVTDEEIASAFEGTNFGSSDHRNLLACSVLKVALNYHCGWTITEIMKRMGLITATLKVTARGKEFCYQQMELGRSG